MHEVLKKKVLRHFGTEGLEWLEKLPRIKRDCVEHWGLEECIDSEVMSVNYIGFCRSRENGEVVLKIGFPHRDLFSEMEALKLYEGRKAVRLIASKPEWGALLVERVLPGENLTSVRDRRERIQIAAQIAAELPRQVKTEGRVPLLDEIAGEAFENLLSAGIQGQEVRDLIYLARKELGEISPPPSPVLLHGDLNHWNILRGREGWRVIDPKGYFGHSCLEAGRFMINELSMAAPGEKQETLDLMVEIFSRKMGKKKAEIARAAFIDKALSLTWKFEDYTRGDLSQDFSDLEILGEFIKGRGR